MEVNMAKQLVVRAGKDLVESGLIARTWGNVSCRIDDKTFAVTPSGRSYETLKPEEIVLCRIEDASYEGEMKPSSEKGIHALIYRSYPNINFVIHTHQPMASVISAAEIDSMPSGNYPLLSDKVPIAAYGLPGTKKLRKNIGNAIADSKSKAVIMAHHGALCFGKDYEETFSVAKQLEEACAEYIKNSYLKISGQTVYEEQKFYNYYISVMTGADNAEQENALLYKSRRLPNGFVLIKEEEATYRFDDDMPFEVQIHRDIYLKRKDINYICQDNNKTLYTVSLTNTSLEPLLDDFAQIVGSSVSCARTKSTKAIVKAIGKRMGVLIPGYGALCCAATESDLHAVELVMEKAAMTQIGTRIIGGSKSISLLDCKLMNFVYKKSYAKKANH